MASRSLKSSRASGPGVSAESKRVKKQIDSLVRGYAFVPASRPPNVIGQPWNNLTAIDIDEIVDKRYYVKDVAAVICNQTGLYRDAKSTQTFINIEFRLTSISVWAEQAHITLYPLDYTRQSSPCELTRVDGSWAKNQWARAGFSFPVSVSNLVLSSQNSPSIGLYQITASSSTRIEVHMKVLWRSAESQVPSLKWIPVKIKRPHTKEAAASDDESDNFNIRPPDDSGACGMRENDARVDSSFEDLVCEVDKLKAVVSRLQMDRSHDG